MASPVSTKQVRDRNWVKQAFFHPRLDNTVNRNDFNEAKIKFYDTSLGGGRAINSVPGFTPNADPIEPGLFADSFGMGNYYSEAIDDPSQIISIQFGVPKFNSLSTFFSNYYDLNMGSMVKSGSVIEKTAFTAGKVTGILLTLPFQAFFGLNSLINRVSAKATGKPYSKFYYMEPAMPLYWNAAQNLVNMLAANMFLAPSLKANNINTDKTNDASGRYNNAGKLNESYELMKQLMGDVYKNDFGIDVYAIATRAQRLADGHFNRLKEMATSSSSPDDYKTKLTSYLKGAPKGQLSLPQGKSFDAYLADYLNTDTAKPISKSDKAVPSFATQDSTGAAETVAPNGIREAASFTDHFRAEVRDGSAFLRLRTNYQGALSESFSNTSKQAPLADKLNSVASTARDFSNTFAGGNIGDNIIVDGIESIVSGLMSFVAGAADSVGFSGAAALGAGAFVEMPDVYESSSAEFSTQTYTLRLGSPYGNKMAIFNNIYIPLCMILAGVLPRATGKSSHGSPFLCRLHSQGRAEIKNGMIERVDLTRFSSNLGESIDHLPTAIDVTITIKNMDTIMSAPISDSLFGQALSFSAFDEDSALTDYLAAMAGMSLYDQYYAFNRLELGWAQTTATWASLTNPGAMASYLGGTFPGRLISSIARAGII